VWIGFYRPLESLNSFQACEIIRVVEHKIIRNWGEDQLLNESWSITGTEGRQRCLFYALLHFDAPLGDTNKIIILGLHTMMKANINILQHMKDSLEGICTPLAFFGLMGNRLMRQ
jgi:hypothetical protein